MDSESAARKALNKKKGDFNAITKANNNYDTAHETDPIQTDTSDSKFLFDNEDAIVVNFKNSAKKDN